MSYFRVLARHGRNSYSGNLECLRVLWVPWVDVRQGFTEGTHGTIKAGYTDVYNLKLVTPVLGGRNYM